MYYVIRFCVLEEKVKSIREFVRCSEYRPYCDIKEKLVVFVWKIYVGITTIEILECITIMMEEKRTQPSQFQDRIIFISMHNDIVYWTKNNKNKCCDKSNSAHRTSKQDIGHFCVLEMRISGTEALSTNPKEKGTQQRRL